jgi:hypothetical protein
VAASGYAGIPHRSGCAMQAPGLVTGIEMQLILAQNTKKEISPKHIQDV